jgi:hypothetical protein
MTKHVLLTAFAERRPLKIKGYSFKFLNAIEHEDGSRHSFNVTGMLDNGKKATVYVRTVD